MTSEEHDAQEAKQRAEARAFIDLALAKYGWKFVGTRTPTLGVIEYEIARLSDDRRAHVQRLLSDTVVEAMLDDEMRALCAARGEQYIELPVSLVLMVMLATQAKRINFKYPPGGVQS